MWVILEILIILLCATTALLLHEMGHAIAVLMRNKKARAEIYMGSLSKEKKLELRFGRITVYLTIAFTGLCRISNPEELPPPTNKQILMVAAGGPVASLLGFGTFYFLAHLIPGVPGMFMNSVAIISLFTFLFTAIPFTYPSFLGLIGGMQNDGLKMVNLLKEMRKHPKAAS